MRKVLTIAFVGMCLSSVALAGDSPQFRGPNRDGRFDEEGLLETWPESGPPLLWVAKGLGKGYSSPSVAGGTIYVPGMSDETTAAIFILSTGGAIERTIPVGAETEDKQAPGPRSTSTI